MTSPADVLSTDAMIQRADAYLRTLCTGYRIDPPSAADVHAYAAALAAEDLDYVPDPGAEWLEDFIDERETAAGERCQATYALLERLGAILDDDEAQACAFAVEDARFASPCGPPPLVLVHANGTAVVVDWMGARLEFGGPRRTRRAHYWTTVRSYLRPTRPPLR
jgi:hypothetical protein